ncbi:hypothetical protein [Paenibacillus pseudetheri]|uniref:Uncharacterized protein n=1 Tax=Paenibacillus pseudetheri TaxID=2897682 RepID=A0ABN8FSE6_9BACL|nr:hypothetical protein [Paenibacillus pseudetheri]CAH1058835.1 hypothetical protein PAECIP111894_05021 [Paenibacillus pseudetheri]
MKKIKKVVGMAFCGSLLMGAVQVSANAADPVASPVVSNDTEQVHNFEVNNFREKVTLDENVTSDDLKLNYIKIEDIIPSNAKAVRTESPNSVKLDLYDKDTGALLVSYSETDKPNFSAKSFATVSAGENRIVTTSTQKYWGPAYLDLTVNMDVFVSGGFKQINGILNTSMQVINSGTFTMEDKTMSAISTTGSFPTYKISATGQGSVVYHYTGTFEAGFSYSAFSAGDYSMSGSITGDWYARRWTTMGLSYSVGN